VLVVVIVVAAALVVMIVGMLVVVAVRMGMRVGMIMLMTVVMFMVVVAGLTGCMVVATVVLGFGRLLGLEQRSHSLRAIVVGLSVELVDGGQGLKPHGFEAGG
jgi:hypothetical protein